MEAVASRDLRNHTADVLRRVSEGGVVAVTVRGEVVAELHPPSDARPRSWRRADLASWLLGEQADPALREDLRTLAGDTTDDLDPLR
jgi:prevent-host-death family protein